LTGIQANFLSISCAAIFLYFRIAKKRRSSPEPDVVFLTESHRRRRISNMNCNERLWRKSAAGQYH
jgi:hypothetical protein